MTSSSRWHSPRPSMRFPRHPEPIQYCAMARAIRPQSGHSLAHALLSLEESDEAIAVFRDSDPGQSFLAGRHYACLGNALRSEGHAREADEVLDSGIAAGRETIRLRPDDPFAHLVLATALVQRNKLDEAVTEYQETTRLIPEYAEAHANLRISSRPRAGMPSRSPNSDAVMSWARSELIGPILPQP